MEINRKITVVLPVYNEGKAIFNNVLEIKKVLDEANIQHEFIMVDDGSSDDTWTEIKKLQEFISVKALRFSRNFGKESAIMAGIEIVDTKACVVMDADLQHPVKKVIEMYELWQNEGFEIIDGVKKQRGKESFFNKICALSFYKFFSGITRFDIDKASDFKFLDKKVVDSLKELSEKETFFRGLATWVGFKRGRVEFDVERRKQGSSNWSFRKLFKLALGAITSFTSLPLHAVTFIGVGFLVGSIILALQTIYMKIAGLAVSGFTTVILLLLIIGSLIMISLGIIGIYIEKIYNEIKGRPRYIVSEKLESE